MTQLRNVPASLLVFVSIAASQACATARPPVGTTPRIEATAGVNFGQHPSAQFPGFMASAAFILPKTPTFGVGLVGDVEGSYLVQTTMAGVRVYGRSQPLYGDKRSVTGFAQLLVGEATGGVSGVLTSEGGFVITPSVGLDYGSGPRAFHLQVGYRRVPNGAVHDSRVPEEDRGALSLTRIVAGMTWRFRAR